MSRPTVFIQANPRQMLGAKISAHSYKKASRRPDSFDVKIMSTGDYPRLEQRGQSILRAGRIRDWNPNDLQSFTPLRFAPPSLMGFEGQAVVTDPDCFAVGDIAELLERDMGGKAIMAVPRPGHNRRNDYVASSVMLLDCARLGHWEIEREIDGLFEHQFDYVDWIELKREDPETIGFLEPEWNHFDQLTPETKILHTTKRRTQPWKTGLPVDYTIRERGPFDIFRRLNKRRYESHPDPNQEALVYSLLADLIDEGAVDRQEMVREMAAKHIRRDSLELVDRYRGWDGVADYTPRSTSASSCS